MSSTPSPLQPATRAAVRPAFWAAALFAGAVLSGSFVHPHFAVLQAMNPDRDDPLTALIGDGRRLFANHFYVKADAYFHSGFYPTIFDNRESFQSAHMAEDAGVTDSRNVGNEEEFLGEAPNWIEVHSRKHFPSTHSHLGEDDPHGEAGAEREILPWLKLSAKLDPNQIEPYTVAAYWLRRTGKPREGEDFLREGLRANPGNPVLLFELGRCRAEDGDVPRARNLWRAAWRRWAELEGPRPPEEQDRFTGNQILLHLAVMESRAGNPSIAAGLLEMLLPIAINPGRVQERLAEVRAGQTLSPLE